MQDLEEPVPWNSVLARWDIKARLAKIVPRVIPDPPKDYIWVCANPANVLDIPLFAIRILEFVL